MSDSELAPFLAAIRAAPEDDSPRLVFADWLDERGESARAELIRTQCELATLGIQHPRLYELGGGEARIAESGEAWLFAPWPKTDDYSWSGLGGDGIVVAFGGVELTWDRGFVDEVRCTADDWLRRGDTVLARHPVTAVTLTSRFPVQTSVGGRCHMRGRPGVPVTRLALPPLTTPDAIRLALLTYH